MDSVKFMEWVKNASDYVVKGFRRLGAAAELWVSFRGFLQQRCAMIFYSSVRIIGKVAND